MPTFTSEEKELIIRFLTKTSVQGTFETLPRVLQLIANIVKKVSGEDQPAADSVEFETKDVIK